MNTAAKQHNWSAFLKFFSQQNHLRPTRIGVFEQVRDTTTDYWLEDGLPLAGIDVDTRGEDAPTVEIMLGDNAKAGSRHMTHIVKRAQTARIILSADGEDDGLEIKDAEGKTTFLRFEE
jgi:hypothetical protein